MIVYVIHLFWVTRILQLSQRNGKLTFPWWKQGIYLVIPIMSFTCNYFRLCLIHNTLTSNKEHAYSIHTPMYQLWNHHSGKWQTQCQRWCHSLQQGLQNVSEPHHHGWRFNLHVHEWQEHQTHFPSMSTKTPE